MRGVPCRFLKRPCRFYPPFRKRTSTWATPPSNPAISQSRWLPYQRAERYSDGEDDIAELARKALRKLEEILTRTTPLQSVDQYLANAELYAHAPELQTS